MSRLREGMIDPEFTRQDFEALFALIEENGAVSLFIVLALLENPGPAQKKLL